jgi:hypothetical protein
LRPVRVWVLTGVLTGDRNFLLVLKDAFEQEGDGAFALSGFAYFGAWGEDA